MLPLSNEYCQKLVADGRSPKTARAKLDSCRYFVNWYGSENMKKVSRRDIQNYKLYLMTEHKTRYWGKRLSDSSIANRLYDIAGYFRFLQERREIFLDPTVGLTAPKVKKFGAMKYLTESEMQELIQKPDTSTPLGIRDRLIFELLYTCPLRCNELVGLKLSEVDMKEKYIYPSRSKGGRECGIPIVSSTYQILKTYLAKSRPLLLKEGKPDVEELFVTRRGGACTVSGIEHVFVKYREGNLRIHPHAIRHSCAVHMRKNGADIRHIQVLLGHKSIESTQVYTDVAKSELKAMQDKYHPREKYFRRNKKLTEQKNFTSLPGAHNVNDLAKSVK